MQNTPSRKVMVIGIIMLFLGTSVVQSIRCTAEKESIKQQINFVANEEKCYGFVIPLVEGDNLPITSIQKSIANAINDCLRMNISVYWAASNFTTLAKEAGTNVSETHTFNQGTFIIPLTGNLSTDTLITTILFNYGYHSEIEQYYPVDYYHLMEPINLRVYHLKEPKIIYYVGDEIVWDWLVFHYDAIQQAGFLNIDFFLQGDNTANLTTNHYNVCICVRRGAGQGIPSIIKSAFNLQRNSALRSFVKQGGGFIGIKYGAVIASSGPSAILGLMKSFQKKPLSITGLSLTNSSYTIGIYTGITTLKITNTSSPIAFGLNTTIRTLCEGGPVFTWLGQHTHSVAIIENVSLPFSPYVSSNNSSSYKTFERWRNSITGEPIWITAEFGKGKVVTYGDDLSLHYAERNDRVFDNSLFYVTSDNEQQMNWTSYQSFSTIESIYMITATITLSPGNLSYQTIWDKVAHLQNISSKINSIEEHIDILLYEMQEERKWDIKIHMLPTIDPRPFQIRLRDLYYDTFTRFLNGFSHAMTTLEAVASTMNNSNVTNLSVIKAWQTRILGYFNEVNYNCTQILSFDQWFTEKLQAFTIKYSDEYNLLKEYNQYDYNIKICYKYLSRAWLETIQLYRMLWYTYEAVTISNALHNYPLAHQTIFLETNHVFPPSTTGVIYVNADSEPGGNGSLAHPYCTIQDGIDAASPGESVYVLAGTYHEHPVISKSLKIIGENKYTTIIDGDGKPRHVVWITADNVTFRGFTVTNCSKKYCGGIVFYSNYNTIIDNIVSDGDIGIGAGGLAHDNVISGNIIENNTYCGIGIDSYYNNYNEISYNTISYNTINNNGYCGLFFIESNDTVHDNTFVNNGIIIYPSLSISSHALIYNNTINGKPLLYLNGANNIVLPNNSGQIILTFCTNCAINKVHITNTNPAIEILSSRNITIENSIFTDNKIGVWVFNSSKLRISQNTFENNSWSGLWLYRSNQNTISTNIFKKNDDGVLAFRSAENYFTNNTFSKNIGGLSFWSTSKRNTIAMNNFFKNDVQTYDQGIDQWRGNYWDDWIGTQHAWCKFIPYHIPGGINSDRHPAQEPYVIP